MIKYKELGYKSFRKGQFENAKMYFSLAYTEKNKEEILFLIGLSEAAKNNFEDANLIFDFYIFNSNLKNSKSFNDLNDLLFALEYNDKNETENEYILKDYAISYSEFKEVVLKNKNFKESLEGIMMSTKLVIKNRESFLSFIEDLLDNEMYQIGVRYFEMFIELHGSWGEKTQHIAQKIKDYEDRITK